MTYRFFFALWWLCSIMPAWWHYFWSDVLYLLLKYVFSYRKDLVRKNLSDSFPEKSEDEITQLQHKFYRHLCDLIVESIFFFTMTRKSIGKRMTFSGTEEVNEAIARGRSIAVFLGHQCNWEWISAMQMWIKDNKGQCLQLYHPLENKTMDRLFEYSRSRFGNINIPMAQSIRHIVKYHKEGKPVLVGFIGDQVPIWESLNYWIDFLHHDTPVMTGGERIARKMDMDCYYLRVKQSCRGHYEAEFIKITDTPKDVPEFYITEQYFRLLEEDIKAQPEMWLWTHNRWKRTRQGFIDHLRREKRWYELDNLRFFDHDHPQGQPASDVDPTVQDKSGRDVVSE